MKKKKIKKFSSGALSGVAGTAGLSKEDLEAAAMMQGPQPEDKRGSISPRVRASTDEFSDNIGGGVNWTTKGGLSIDLDVDKTQYKDSDYQPPESYSASLSKENENSNYYVRGRKQGQGKQIEAGFTWKYGKKKGGMANCRGMGKAIKGGKFIGVK